jgi:tRNA(His) guanylyltransferase
MIMSDSLGDRMKNNYENVTRNVLVRRMPVIMRIDGKAFHTLTKSCVKPFDKDFSDAMILAANNVMSESMGAKLAYIQSDEISILLTDYDNLESEAWFNNNIQKLCSISASMAAVAFSNAFEKNGYFDCRVFNIPKEEVNNYFIWRQQDWIRNSLQMLSRSYYNQKELHNKNTAHMHDMLMEKGVNWSKLDPARWKNGYTLFKSGVGVEDFIFKDRWDVMNEIVGL